jgi:hypothetical protein
MKEVGYKKKEFCLPNFDEIPPYRTYVMTSSALHPPNIYVLELSPASMKCTHGVASCCFAGVVASVNAR